mmetsp:Transcript_72505/g.212510  ORF Transcript_72505/g.212510 Transcript_72505/m.212510 type:complete len:269 (-) Transcript_72505:438-1244(-)
MFGITNTSPDPKAPAPEEPPLRFSIVIQKPDGVNLGIDVAYSPKATWTRHGVFVSKVVEDGLVDAWNLESQDPRRVQPGDFIFQVNDVHSDTVSIIMELKVKQTVTIHVLRSRHLGGEEEIQCLQGHVPERRYWQGPATPNAADLESMMSSCGIPRGPAAQSQERRFLQGPATPNVADLESMMSSCGVPCGPAAQTEEDVVGIPRTALCAGGFAGPPSGSAEGCRPRSLRVEALAPRLAALGDDALAALFCAVLEHRPAAREALLCLQ